MKEDEAKSLLPGPGDMLQLVKEVCATNRVHEVNEFDLDFGVWLVDALAEWMAENN